MIVPVELCESFIHFKLPDGSRHHEEVNPAGPGVDLEIASKTPVWLEVKNWESPWIPPQHRPRVDQDFVDKTNTRSPFWDELVAKFEGTYDCLLALGQLPETTLLAVLLESRLFAGRAVAPAVRILQSRVASSNKIAGRAVVVLNLVGLGRYVPEAVATSCYLVSGLNCLSPVQRCSAVRRLHRSVS